MIDLAQCTTVKSADLKSKKRHSFEISTPDLTYLLYADTEQEKDDWIGRVGKAIVRCSNTYYDATNTNTTNTTNSAGVGGSATGRDMGPGMNQGARGGMYGGEEDDDDDIYYEDPNNPNPYFND